MQKLTQLLQAKWYYTLLLIVGLSFVSYTSWLGLILLALFTLQQNIKLGAVALSILIVTQAILPLLQHQSIAWLVVMSYVFVSFSALLLKNNENWGNLLTMAVVWALVAIFILYQMTPDIQAQWQNFETWLMYVLDNEIKNMVSILAQNGLNLPLGARWIDAKIYYQNHQVGHWLPSISTGLLISSYVLGNLVFVLIAYSWYLKYSIATVNKPNLLTIRLHIAATLALALVLICPVDSLPYRSDMLCALLIFYFIAGLSLAHWLTQLLSKPWIGVIVLYIALTFMPFIAGIAIIILAIIDSIFNVRTYLAAFIKKDALGIKPLSSKEIRRKR